MINEVYRLKPGKENYDRKVISIKEIEEYYIGYIILGNSEQFIYWKPKTEFFDLYERIAE